MVATVLVRKEEAAVRRTGCKGSCGAEKKVLGSADGRSGEEGKLGSSYAGPSGSWRYSILMRSEPGELI